MTPRDIRTYLFDSLRPVCSCVNSPPGRRLPTMPRILCCVPPWSVNSRSSAKPSTRHTPRPKPCSPDERRRPNHRLSQPPIHAYAFIADEVVWGVLEANLSTLQREVMRCFGKRRTDVTAYPKNTALFATAPSGARPPAGSTCRRGRAQGAARAPFSLPEPVSGAAGGDRILGHPEKPSDPPRPCTCGR